MERSQQGVWNQEEIYAIENALHNNPHHILGLQEQDGMVFVNAYFPNTIGMKCISKQTGEERNMEAIDEYGFYSILWKKEEPYLLKAEFENGSSYCYQDAYCFEPIITTEDIEKFQAGCHTTIYKLLGAHKRIEEGISGVLFAVWAPNADRVSVVGDFNL